MGHVFERIRFQHIFKHGHGLGLNEDAEAEDGGNIKAQSIIIFGDFIWYQVISYKLAPPRYECLFTNLIKIH